MSVHNVIGKDKTAIYDKERVAESGTWKLNAIRLRIRLGGYLKLVKGNRCDEHAEEGQTSPD